MGKQNYSFESIYGELEYYSGFLQTQSETEYALGQYVLANNLGNASALLVRLSIILKTIDLNQNEDSAQ